MNWYCEYSEKHPHHKSYHDTEYGFPTDDNTVIFERLSLEIFQAGLSWDLMIKKRSGLRKAFADFDIDKIATFGEEFVLKQLDNPDIIRSRRKIEAIIYNAKQAQALIKEYGSLAKWIKINHPLPLEGWTKLFKKQFKFIGPEVMKEFMMGIGYIEGAHHENCPAYKEIMKKSPMWARKND